MMTRSMSTPISAAVSASWAVARMPRPRRERATKRSRAAMRSRAPRMTRSLSLRTSAPATDARWVLFSTRGNPSRFRPYRAAKSSWRNSDTPMAVMRAARRGAPRRRRGR